MEGGYMLRRAFLDKFIRVTLLSPMLPFQIYGRSKSDPPVTIFVLCEQIGEKKIFNSETEFWDHYNDKELSYLNEKMLSSGELVIKSRLSKDGKSIILRNKYRHLSYFKKIQKHIGLTMYSSSNRLSYKVLKSEHG